MAELISLLWKSRFGAWFSLGKRWILLIPGVWIGVWILLVLTILVSAEFEPVKEAFGLSDAQAVITHPYFLVLSAVIVLLCPLVFWIVTHRRPPKDRIVVAVPKFYFPPESERAKKEASDVHDRVRTEIQTRMNGIGMKCSTPIPRETAQEPLDAKDDEGKKRARLLGRHYRAHMVVCGRVRLHKSYYFEPHIENLATRKHRFSPSGRIEALDIPERESHTFMEQKVDEVADLATFICALAQINRSEYKKAKQILDAIPEDRSSAEVWFYRGLALLKTDENLEDVKQALSCFEEASRLRPNFAFALMYAGIASRKLSQKVPVGYVSPTFAGLSAGYFSLASEVPSEESPGELLTDLKDSARRDRHLAQDISKKLLAFQLEDLGDLAKAFEGLVDRGNQTSEVLGLRTQVREVEDEAMRYALDGEERLNAGDPEGAVQALDRATELSDRAAHLRLELDESLGRITEPEEPHGRDTERTTPLQALQGRAWAWKALALARLDRFDEARRAAQRGTELDGEHYVLARAYAVMGDKANTLEHLSVATNDDPGRKLSAEMEEEFDPFREDEAFTKLTERRPGELEEAHERRRSEREREDEKFIKEAEESTKEHEENEKRRAEREKQREERRGSPLVSTKAQWNMAAKRRVRSNPGFFRFRLGALECISINDGTFNYPLESFFANAPPEQVKEALRRRNLLTNQIATLCTCLLVDTRQHRVLVDTGAGALGWWYANVQFPEIDHTTTVTGRLLDNMRAAGVEPSQIDTVIITHAHPEQLGSTLDEDGELVFANARYLISKDELNFWFSDAATTKALDPEVDLVLVTTVRVHLKALEGRLYSFDGQLELVPGISAIPMPGHTPGHTALSITSNGEQLLHVSDAVLHPLHLEHPEWSPVFDVSPEEATASKRRIFDHAAEERALVFAHHFHPFPNLGHVTKEDEGWQWQPVEKKGS